MKPTASALRHFVLGAAATAIASTWSKSSLTAVVAQPSETVTSESASLLHDRQTKDREHPGLLHDPLPRTIGHDSAPVSSSSPGPLRNSTPATDTGAAAEPHEPCHPDLGVLACNRPGDLCTKTNPSPVSSREAEEREEDDLESWYCLPQRIPPPGTRGEAIEKEQPQPQTKRKLNVFPPTGTYYDQCTYDEQLEYKPYSSIREPSAWDRCACMKYDYNLPSTTPYYTDVDYCFKIHKYYCKNYHPPYDVNKQYSNYEVCVCGSYEGKPVPDEPDDFCVEIGKKHCEDYYPNGDLVGFADCLCDNFGYQDWCDWTPPPGFSPVPPPPPPTSTGPTVSPGPTRTPTRNPTAEPTVSPTREPTRTPTLEPTRWPSRPPTRKPTYAPTLPPTREPTSRPTREPTRNPTLPPTRKPTPLPTGRPTPAPTLFPTRLPVVGPTAAITDRPTVRPRATPGPRQTPRPTLRPTLDPTVRPRATPGPRQTTPRPTLDPTERPTERPTNQPTERPTGRPTLFPTRRPLTPAPVPLQIIDVDATNENTNGDNNNNNNNNNEDAAVAYPVNNISNLANIITFLKRQPSISNRPGSALRIQTYNVFDHSSIESKEVRKSTEGSSF